MSSIALQEKPGSQSYSRTVYTQVNDEKYSDRTEAAQRRENKISGNMLEKVWDLLKRKKECSEVRKQEELFCFHHS